MNHNRMKANIQYELCTMGRTDDDPDSIIIIIIGVLHAQPAGGGTKGQTPQMR